MNDLLAALLLGIIEGITEFLPISSTGHLLIAERWLGHRSDLFNIAIQAGAILAVVVIYRQRLWQMLLGFREAQHRDYLLKLGAAFGVTAVLGLVVKAMGFQLPEKVAPIAWALIIGGFVMLYAERLAARRAAEQGERSQITWTVAILVGIAQVVAGVFPGTSRSAAAIFAALLFGTGNRVAATEFAFLIGIPTMFAATGYELVSVLRNGEGDNEDWGALAIAFVAAAITAFAAVKWLLTYIQTHRFTAFAWYRIALGVALLAGGLVASAATPRASNTPQPSLPANELVSAATVHSPNVTAASSGEIAGNRTLAARGGRAEEATRAYRALKLCVDAENERDWIEEPGSRAVLDAYSRGERNTSADPAWRKHLLDRAAGVLERQHRAKVECIGVDGAVHDGSIYLLARRAAILGDRDAAYCYASLAWEMTDAQVRDPAFRASYDAVVHQLIARGIAAGDWRMVGLARVASQHPLPASHIHNELFGRAPGILWLRQTLGTDDWERTVALVRLKQAGSSEPAWADSYGKLAENLSRRHLSDAQRQRAESWARRTFVNAFSAKRSLHNDQPRAATCGGDPPSS